ncbi:hypothetical protein Theam_1515 [Thermovibrio ammonificans HB-1]|uniref:Fimbrial assembly family protein n=1 Tax=Thermovibrio ammonificans (strain DSM 15698 / JCM 12110 / HB-1) TaxID=648996 RepID=E8T4L8_THEA1|nr:PilN domain-containing protein [Thermovibrio ammonificans]ADU97476.1 hypothetical protein Theam_1515 [Thermovibrio ammonificans HB-1]
MIGVDAGSSAVKWFDGKAFGLGELPAAPLVVGVSSATALVKFSDYPVCKGTNLKRLIVSDVAAELSVSPSEVAVAYCPVERLEKGCRFLTFVEKVQVLNSLREKFKELSFLTVDAVGGATAGYLLFGESPFTVLDAGASKLSCYRVEGGLITGFELLRGGFSYHLPRLSAAVERLKGLFKGKLLLVGGGALSEEFKGELGKLVSFEVPEIHPFGRETPLFFNAYGLRHLRRFRCRAFFFQRSLFNLDFLQKNRLLLVKLAGGIAVSLFFFTAAQVVQLVAAKRDYTALKGELYSKLSELLGEKVVAPEIQIPQEIESLKEEARFLLADRPPLLLYLDAISRSVVKGLKVLEIEGDIKSGRFTVTGLAQGSNLVDAFVANLRARFRKVSVSSTSQVKGGVKFTVTVSGVKLGR